MSYTQQVICLALLGLNAVAASNAVSFRVQKHSQSKQVAKEVVCPAPVFVPETLETGITICVCKLGDKCPSTVKVLDPEEAAKLAQEAFQWVENGAPYSLAQFGGREIKCPAPIFVAECTDDGTCFCVCKDKETCPSLAIILEPEEAAKKFQEAYEWVKNGSPWGALLQRGALLQSTKAALLQSGANSQDRDVVCPAPVFVPETLETGITICVCKLGDKCPSTVKVLDPEEAAKLAQEAFQWVENGAPYSLAQFGGREIKCPAPIFVAECTDDGTCFCVCKDKETCPSLAIILPPEEAAAKFQEAYEWVKNGAPYDFVQLKQLK